MMVTVDSGIFFPRRVAQTAARREDRAVDDAEDEDRWWLPRRKTVKKSASAAT